MGPALVRRDPFIAHARHRRPADGRDLGEGLVGPLVGVGRADARFVPDHLPALRLLPAAALLDRGPGPAGALRGRVRGSRGRVRAAELPRRAAGTVADAPAGAGEHRQPAKLDGADFRRLPGRDGAALRDAVEVRDRLQAGAHAAQVAAAPVAGGLMPALPLHEAGKYVAGAYIVFIALILIYVVIMAIRLQRIERDLTELDELAARKEREAADEDASDREEARVP